MFNGIIFKQGKVKKISKRKKGINIFVYSKLKISKKDIGMSISCDGVCLTLINISNKLMEFYLSTETIKRSNFKNFPCEAIRFLSLYYSKTLKDNIAHVKVLNLGSLKKQTTTIR